MSISVLDIPLYDKPLRSFVDELLQTCLGEVQRANRKVSATGAHGLVLARENEEFAHALRSFHRNLPDGVPSVWVGRLKGAKKMERCYGPAVFEAIMEASAESPIRHFLCGGKAGVAIELARVTNDRFKNANCVGTYSPPFRELTPLEFESLAAQITASKADVVWIGLSTPKQELFAVDLSKYISVHYIITVGAAFDFHTGRLRQAPRWLQRIGMEWFFRLVIEPRRLYKRYIEIVPLFLYYAAKDLLKNHYRNQLGE